MTVTFNKLLLVFCCFHCVFMVTTTGIRYKRFPKNITEPKHRILPLRPYKIHKLRSIAVCYEKVGCFEIPRHHNPLQSLPEFLDTEFYLYRRDINFSDPEVLNYKDNLQSLQKSKFVSGEPVKILVHGYMTRWNEIGALAGVQAYLDIAPCNVILVNWERGASGPRYSTAAANTELVGRQLGLLLLDLISFGIRPHQIHLIGFSLGAHVAACASQELKDRGMLVGRITGLDPASPLFKLNHFRDNRKKLDISDAAYVDVIHTDGSPVFTDGFGLLEPLGHVDFFPNGGREQPGCNDIKNSVVVSHFDKNLDREIACSHIRAYHYFLETLLMKAAISKGTNTSNCQFTTFSCRNGPQDFAMGRCFPVNTNANDGNHLHSTLGLLGDDSFGHGVMYLMTRDSQPFCGMQIQIIFYISPKTKRTKGILNLNLIYGNSTHDVLVTCDLSDAPHLNKRIYGLTALDYNSMSRDVTKIILNLTFHRYKPEPPNPMLHNIFVDKIEIRTITGLSWQHHGYITIQQNKGLSVLLS